jgi:hypothetical protein
MVIRLPDAAVRHGAWLMIDLVVAMAIIAGALLPLAYSIASEKRYARAAYQRAIAVAIVDGEAELLAAGGWRDFADGAQEYRVKAAAATNLPPGRFLLTRDPRKLRLEWRPDVRQHGGPVVREVRLE